MRGSSGGASAVHVPFAVVSVHVPALHTAIQHVGQATHGLAARYIVESRSTSHTTHCVAVFLAPVTGQQVHAVALTHRPGLLYCHPFRKQHSLHVVWMDG